MIDVIVAKVIAGEAVGDRGRIGSAAAAAAAAANCHQEQSGQNNKKPVHITFWDIRFFFFFFLFDF
jgi:hypothetical protein